MNISILRLIYSYYTITVFAHEDTNNLLFTKYGCILFGITLLCADTE